MVSLSATYATGSAVPTLATSTATLMSTSTSANTIDTVGFKSPLPSQPPSLASYQFSVSTAVRKQLTGEYRVLF